MNPLVPLLLDDLESLLQFRDGNLVIRSCSIIMASEASTEMRHKP